MKKLTKIFCYSLDANVYLDINEIEHIYEYSYKPLGIKGDKEFIKHNGRFVVITKAENKFIINKETFEEIIK